MDSDNDADTRALASERLSTSRRRVLGLLSGTAVAGLAGCFGDGDDTDQPTGTAEPTGTTDPEGTTESPGMTETPDDGTPTPTEEPQTDTATPEPGAQLPDDPQSIVSFDETQAQPAFPGAETTLSMTLQNPYLGLELADGEISLEASDDGFSFGDATGNTFDALESGGNQTVEWPVTVPSEDGEYTVTVTETYSAGEDSAEITSEITVVVAFDSVVSLDASEAQPAYPGETVTVSSTFENPYDVALDGGNVTLEASADAFGVTVATDPGFDTLEPGSTTEGAWEVVVPEATGEYTMTATATASVNDQGAEDTLQTPANVLSIEQRDDEILVPQTGGGVPSEPAFTLLPEGDDLSEIYPGADGPDDLSGSFYFGYDADNLYIRAEITDDTHVAKSGEMMWQNDNIQYAAGIDGEYGPEYGASHVDGTTETWRWVPGQATQGLDSVTANTSRDDANNLTTYEITAPWETLFSESKGAGDSFNFSVQINGADSEGSERETVLGWTLPGINREKSYDELGRFHLEEPSA
jgi:hypothetical protein